MSPSPGHETPPQLARFPDAVREDFNRYRETGDRAAVERIVLAVLADFLPEGGRLAGGKPLDDRLELMDDLGYDSLAIAEIVFFLEDLFGVVINNADLQNVRTVGDLRAFVNVKLDPSRSRH